MEQKGFEKKLDEVTEKISKTVSEGVKRVEESLDKGKQRLREDPEAGKRWKALAISPSGGLIIVGVGILWLLYTLGVFGHPVPPILLIIFGLYLIFRKYPE
ncbi:MAG: hypothetical protein GTO51_10655 [Candidatus Latescibacteria bacterium]|nr:hypothetical protein [Candidatus Latescibacterota bacterium]NIM66426.1 hypothetical protein [Candidatus Latescibacterota bacterium]NIO02906.1 hypothetical protein [Candidatus Latescibacterota bacterium]NIO30041.1 hypothetical protein [Candidatus Latescibacterota bacterium]NIO57656.1 hypothetical protein [Candidatus Latescibacterota bacterium]